MDTDTRRNLGDLREIAWVRQMCTSGAARQLRASHGLSLREIATPTRVSPQTVLRWETGLNRPTGARALAYARVLRRMERVSA